MSAFQQAINEVEVSENIDDEVYNQIKAAMDDWNDSQGTDYRLSGLGSNRNGTVNVQGMQADGHTLNFLFNPRTGEFDNRGNPLHGPNEGVNEYREAEDVEEGPAAGSIASNYIPDRDEDLEDREGLEMPGAADDEEDDVNEGAYREEGIESEVFEYLMKNYPDLASHSDAWRDIGAEIYDAIGEYGDNKKAVINDVLKNHGYFEESTNDEEESWLDMTRRRDSEEFGYDDEDEVDEAQFTSGDAKTTRLNPLVAIYDADEHLVGHMNLKTYMHIYQVDSSHQIPLADRVRELGVGEKVPVRSGEGEYMYIEYSPHSDKDMAEESMGDTEVKKVGNKIEVTKDNETTTYDDEETAAAMMKDDDDQFESYNHPDVMKEAFGAYDDMSTLDAGVEPVDYEVNPDLVKFDSHNPEHRERLQRGTKVVLVPVMFQEPNSDRTGVLADIAKSGFFCKVIRNADGQEVNAHLGDIEYADLFNNTVYEEFENKLNKLLAEEITVTRTENAENPELDTMTVTATEESVDELAAILANANVSSAEPEVAPPDADPAADEPEVELIDTTEEELIREYEREIRHANTPDEHTSTVDAATNRTAGGINKPKRHYDRGFPGDNVMAAMKEGKMSELDIILSAYPAEELLNWVHGDNNEELDADLLDWSGEIEDGSGRTMERIYFELKDEIEGYAREKQEEERREERDAMGLPQEESVEDLNRMRQFAGLPEADVGEGNKFSGELKKAKKRGDDDFEVDGKTYQVEGDDDDDMDQYWKDAEHLVRGEPEKMKVSQGPEPKKKEESAQRPGEALDETESFLDLYKKFGEY